MNTKRKIRKHLELRLRDAIHRKAISTNSQTKEYWFGKETAYREMLAILNNEFNLR